MLDELFQDFRIRVRGLLRTQLTGSCFGHFGIRMPSNL